MPKAKLPEFTTHAGAIAFLRKGRGDKMSRATADGWNTTVNRVGNDIELRYGSVCVAKFTEAGLIQVERALGVLGSYPMLERLNRYVFSPRKMSISKQGTVFGESETLLVGGVPAPVKIVPGGNTPLTMDDAGTIISPVPFVPPVALNRTEWRDKAVAYANRVEDHVFDLNVCSNCADDSSTLFAGGTQASLSEVMRDTEHLYAHIAAGVYPGELVVRGSMWTNGAAWTKQKMSSGPSTVQFAEDVALSFLRRGLKYYLTRQI